MADQVAENFHDQFITQHFVWVDARPVVHQYKTPWRVNARSALQSRYQNGRDGFAGGFEISAAADAALFPHPDSLTGCKRPLSGAKERAGSCPHQTRRIDRTSPGRWLVADGNFLKDLRSRAYLVIKR